MVNSSSEQYDVHAARQLIQRYFTPTRLVPAHSLNKGSRAEIYLKLESEMPTGSFKVRGALYALRSALCRRPIAEVVASSTGNHGAAVAYAAKLLGVPATIFLPLGANSVKHSRIRALGGEIIEQGGDIGEAAAAAQDYARGSNAYFLNDATDPDIPAGTATIGLEILENLPEVAAIWVPVGDTALIRGVAFAAKRLRPEVRLIGVQAERAPSYYLSWKHGVSIPTTTCDTIADGLATRIPVDENVAAICGLVDDIRLVTEVQMLNAIEHLLIAEHIVAEPAGAATTAAWLADSSQTPGAVVLLVTGANISKAILGRALCDGINRSISQSRPEQV
jgi:threonine dehydratase